MYRTVEEVKKRIEQNCEAVTDVLRILENDAMESDEPLKLIEILAYFMSENITGFYSSHKLECMLTEISRNINFKEDSLTKKGEYLFVMTTASAGGGSTVIVNNWIRWDKNKKYSVVFTNMGDNAIPSFLEEAVRKSGGRLYYLRGSFIEKASSLLRISSGFEKAITFHHQADIVPNLAYGNPGWNRPVIMYNHANFRFSLGYEISDKLLNLSDYDMERAISFRGVAKEKSALLQFPNGGKICDENSHTLPDKRDRKYVRGKYQIEENKKLIVTMGEQFKLSDVFGCSFVGFVKQPYTPFDRHIERVV